MCECQVLGPTKLQICTVPAVPVETSTGNQACWWSLCNDLYVFMFIYLIIIIIQYFCLFICLSIYLFIPSTALLVSL